MNDSELDNMLREMAAKKSPAPDLGPGVRAEIARRRSADALPWSFSLCAGTLAAALAIGFVATFATVRNDSAAARRAETAAALHLDSFSAPDAFVTPVATLSTTATER